VRAWFLILLVFLIFSGYRSFGQETILECTDSTFCIPSVAWMPRTKGIEINRETVYDYKITSTGKNGYPLNGEGEIGTNSRTEIKIKAPIILKPNLKIALGIRYFQEEFEFEDLAESDLPFYTSLDDKDLKSLGATLYIVKPFKGNKYFLLRARGSLNGDYTKDDAFTVGDFLRFSVAPMIGWKKNPYTSFAVGAAFGVDFGRYSIYPVFSYNQSFSPKWGIESLIPVKIKLRYTPNPKNLLYLKTEFKGANYRISLDDPNLESDRLYNLQKLEIRYLLTYEREIHDWLWFGVESGLRSNVRFNLDESDFGRDTIIENEFNSAFILKVSIFVVPPRKLLE